MRRYAALTGGEPSDPAEADGSIQIKQKSVSDLPSIQAVRAEPER